MLTAFNRAICDRQQRCETLDLIVIGEKDSTIIDAKIVGSNAEITVRFVADVVEAMRSENGAIISGDLKHITETCDIWTFSRDLASADPSWRLTVTENAQSLPGNGGGNSSLEPKRYPKGAATGKAIGVV